MARKNPAYSKADMEKWRNDMLILQPGPSGAAPFMAGATITSLTSGHTDTGMILVLRNTQGETQTVALNPVVAHALRTAILHCGTTGNWMHANGEIIPPTLSKG